MRAIHYAALLAPFLVGALCNAASGQNCSKTSTGLVPLSDLGTAKYAGFEGGLYGGGANAVPAAHRAAGLVVAGRVQPRAKDGSPDPKDGRIVVISCGMSNTTQEFSTWQRLSDADPERAGVVRLVDCAQGGQPAETIANPNANYWKVADQRIQNAGLTNAQVQVCWLKQAIRRPSAGFPQESQRLQGYLVQILQIMKARYPNLEQCFVSSRIYAGYATSTLNPEPYAYESAFAVQWLVRDQIGGSPALNYDANKGSVKAPWIAWGPYTWADGTKGRKIDALVWNCNDFAADGTHPSTSGRNKVAGLLDAHFRAGEYTKSWYIGPGGGTGAAVRIYDQGCSGSRPSLVLRNNGLPKLGNARFTIGIGAARASRPAVVLLAGDRAKLALDASCNLLIDPAKLFLTLAGVTSSGGQWPVRLPVPNDATLEKAKFYAQFFVSDDRSTALRVLGGGLLSAGLEMRLSSN